MKNIKIADFCIGTLKFGIRRGKKAFTIAEVLIVLGIIGIIAQMTIPALYQSYQKTVFVTQFKKFVSVFQNGLREYVAQKGCYDLICTGMFEGRISSSSTPNAFESAIDQEIKSAFKIIKSCNTRNSGCGHVTNYLDNSAGIDSFYYGHSFQTADGMVFMLSDQDVGNCTANGSITTSSKLKNYCTVVYIDVNGSKKPNKWGRDMFFLYLGKDGVLYPAGGIETTKINEEDYESSEGYWRNSGNCGTPGSSDIEEGALGTNCSARIMESGWVMDY